MRPVMKGPDPGYAPNNYFQFGGGNVAAVTAFVAPLPGYLIRFPVAPCLQVVLDQLLGNPLPHGVLPAQRLQASAAIQGAIENMYKQASVPLTTQLGAFCSYCETPLPGLLEVEHCVPKACYPTFSTSWDNFLLSCGPCNTAKANTPDRLTAAGWAGGVPTEQDLYNAIRNNHYTWPDLTDQSYRWMPLVLQYDSGAGGWQDIATAQSINENIYITATDIATRVVTAYIDPTGGGVYANHSVRVVVRSATGGLPVDRAQETIALCNLNGVGDPASTYDRRMMNRTLAWFSCITTMSLIYQAPSPAAANLLWHLAELHAVASGFFSVWLVIINDVFPGEIPLYLADLNVAGSYPNTNLAALP